MAAKENIQGETKRNGRHLVIAMPKRGVDAPFRRSVRDSKGTIVETIVFPRGEPIELDDVQFAAVAADIKKGALKSYDADRPRTPEQIREQIRAEEDEAERIATEDRRRADASERRARDEGLDI
jgi:hypothetical protein